MHTNFECICIYVYIYRNIRVYIYIYTHKKYEYLQCQPRINKPRLINQGCFPQTMIISYLI
jgi:hypothetical protein